METEVKEYTNLNLKTYRRSSAGDVKNAGVLGASMGDVNWQEKE